jgi:hypothetical protein
VFEKCVLVNQKGLKMTEASSQLPTSQTSEARRFIHEAWPRNPLDEPSVRFWRAAGRVSLAALFGFSAMQYYLFDAHLTILAMPRVTVLAALP